MFKRLKRLTAIAGISALAVISVPLPAQAGVPGWSSGAGVNTGETAHHGTIVGPDNTKYMCAADGGSWSINSAPVEKGSMKPAQEMDHIDATSFSGPGQKRAAVKVTDAATLAKISWIASEAKADDNIEAASSQIAIVRAAGVFKSSVYELAELGKFPYKNGENLTAPLTRSKEIVANAEKFAGPYTVKPDLTLDADASTGTVGNIGVTSASGNWVSGKPYTLEISGPAVFADTGKATLSGTTSEKAATASIKATGNGEISVKLVVTDLATAKPWVSLGERISGKNIGPTARAQNLIVLNKKTQAEGVTQAKPVNLAFQPKISTQVKAVEVAKGSSLVDTVTASAEGTWPNVPGTQTPLPVNVKVDVYGPFPSPAAQTNDGAAFASKKVGSYDLTFNGPGTVETPGTVTAPSEGFYFFHAHVDKAAQGQYQNLIKDYSSPFFEVSETSVTKWTPSITTKASQVDLGNGKAGVQDLVTVSGFPEDHGAFKGIGNWAADKATITHRLYFVPASVELKEGVTANMQPVATVETPAKNGTYTVQGKDFPIDWNLGVGTYVIVSNFAGDSRVNAITTSELDKNEHVSPTFGKVSTTAFTENGGELKPGAKIGDKVMVEGNLPEGSYTEVNLYAWAKNGSPKCEKPIWTSKRLEHSNQPGEYKTDLYATGNEQATYGFVETTYDKNGNVISRGKCGAQSETLTTGELPKPKTPTTAPSKPKLARTGASVTTLAGVAVGLMLIGAVGVYSFRRKKA